MNRRSSPPLWVLVTLCALVIGVFVGHYIIKRERTASTTAFPRARLSAAPARPPADVLDEQLQWLLEETELNDSKISFGVHEVEIAEESMGLVYSVSPGPSAGYSGGLWPAEESSVVDAEGRPRALTAMETWTVYGNTTIGSVSFEAISSTTQSAALVIPYFNRSDGKKISGPWHLGFLRLGGVDAPDARGSVYGAAVNADPVVHDGESVRYVSSFPVDYDPDARTPTPEDTEETIEGTPTSVGTPAPTSEPIPTLEFAPNALMLFTLRAWSSGPGTVRYVHGAFEPTEGMYYYELLDRPD